MSLVGSISNADIEKILSLEPDLVLASTHFSDDAVKQLDDAGVPVCISMMRAIWKAFMI